MSQPTRPQSRFRVAQLNPRQPTPFTLAPDADGRTAIAAELGLSALPSLRFIGEIRPAQSDAWQVSGQLSAKVVQPCVVTLAPVKSSISEQVHRLFSPNVTTPEGDEIEMGDDDVEQLGQFIDAEAIMIEALSLALPLYPRADGAELDAPHDDLPEETRKPFAGLADLLKQPKS